MRNDNREKQYKIFCIFITIMLVCAIGLFVMLPDLKNKNPFSSITETASMETPLAHVDITAVLLQQAENRLVTIQKEIQVVQQQLQLLRVYRVQRYEK
jgi:hypothetical protein